MSTLQAETGGVGAMAGVVEGVDALAAHDTAEWASPDLCGAFLTWWFLYSVKRHAGILPYSRSILNQIGVSSSIKGSFWAVRWAVMGRYGPSPGAIAIQYESTKAAGAGVLVLSAAVFR